MPSGVYPRKRMGRRRRLDMRRVLKLHFRGLSGSEIAAVCQVSKQAVSQALAGCMRGWDSGRLEFYREHKSQIIEGVEMKTLDFVVDSLLDPGKREKASIRDAYISYGIMFDKTRLQTGQSTANVALHSLVEQMHREIRGKASRALPDDTPGKDDA